MPPPREEDKVHEREALGRQNLEKATPKVRDLSRRDLDDLAHKFKRRGGPNPKVDELEVDDIKSLEDVFQGFKGGLVGRLESGELDLDRAGVEEWSVSCCCCTPCCCAAAGESAPVGVE